LTGRFRTTLNAFQFGLNLRQCQFTRVHACDQSQSDRYTIRNTAISLGFALVVHFCFVFEVIHQHIVLARIFAIFSNVAACGFSTRGFFGADAFLTGSGTDRAAS
jgi:hypothetical protein